MFRCPPLALLDAPLPQLAPRLTLGAARDIVCGETLESGPARTGLPLTSALLRSPLLWERLRSRPRVCIAIGSPPFDLELCLLRANDEGLRRTSLWGGLLCFSLRPQGDGQRPGEDELECSRRTDFGESLRDFDRAPQGLLEFERER